MKKVLASFLVILIYITSYGQAVVDAIGYESYNNAKNTYNYTYWDSNWKTAGISTRKFTNQTSSYKLSINYTGLSIASLNINSGEISPSRGFEESNAATFSTTQAGDIEVKILKDGSVFNELSASAPTRQGGQISQMADYGTWCNRRVLDSLNFTNSASVYGSYTGVEFTNWHNRFRIAFQLKLREKITDGQMQLIVDMPDAFSEVFYSDGVYGFATGKEGKGFAVKGGITADSIAVCGNTITVTTSAKTLQADTQYTLSLIFYAVKDNFCTRYANTADDGQNLSITSSQTLPDQTSSAPVSFSKDEGVYFIDVPSYNMGNNNEDNTGILQNINIEIENNEPESKRVRLCFYDNSHKNVTGFTSMIRNSNGDPSGIPLQISKNWHKTNSLLYAAIPNAYSKEYTELIIPANTTLKFDYTRVGALWGNVYAASSHQLSVVGAGVPRGGWLQAALGSFGESVTHSPDYEYGNTNVCDYRPFLVTNKYYGLESSEYGWTGNLGGLDLFRYDNGSGSRIYQSQVKTRFVKYGPNLTETKIGTYSSDNALKMDYTFQLQRSDDYLRVYYKVKVKALKDVAFSRFDIFQLGSDNYNLFKAQDLVYGDSAGVAGQFTPTNSTINDYTTDPIALSGKTPWIWAGDGIYTRDFAGLAIHGNSSMIIRSYNASFAGESNNTPYFRERVSSTGYSASTGQNPTSYCIVPPPGVTSFTAGDSIELLVEVCLLPKVADVYYGPNENFRAALTTYGNSWELVHREAVGNTITASSATNAVHEGYPLTIEAVDNKAEVTVSGGVGYVPIVFSKLSNIEDPKLWRVDDGVSTLVDQSNHGKDFWQTEYDTETGLYEIIYNVNQDIEGDSVATYTYKFETASSDGPNSADTLTLIPSAECSVFNPINTTTVCHIPSAVDSRNIALNGVATQSSTDYGGVASRAIDGNTDGIYNSGSTTHTAGGEAIPWWQVDLLSEYNIDQIEIFGRTDDCCKDRLSNFTVYILDSSGDTTFSQFFASYPDPSVTVDAGGVRGKIVRIELDGGVISLAEVEVYDASIELSFIVSDESSNANLPDVIVDINNLQYATNEAGAVSVDLSSGSYNYALSAYAYHSVSKVIDLAQDTTLTIRLIPKEKFTLAFELRDTNTLTVIQDADLAIADTLIRSDELGFASIDLMEEEYTYTISHDKYSMLSQSLSLTKDTTLAILMSKKMYSLEFQVKDSVSMEKLEAVSISINDTVYLTDEQGNISLDLSEGEYTYTLSKEGYTGISESLALSKDTVLSVILIPLPSDIKNTINEGMKIYPNPVNDIINIELKGAETAKLEIINSLGQVVLSGILSNGMGSFDMKDLPCEMYLVKTTYKEHTQSIKIVKK